MLAGFIYLFTNRLPDTCLIPNRASLNLFLLHVPCLFVFFLPSQRLIFFRRRQVCKTDKIKLGKRNKSTVLQHRKGRVTLHFLYTLSSIHVLSTILARCRAKPFLKPSTVWTFAHFQWDFIPVSTTLFVKKFLLRSSLAAWGRRFRKSAVRLECLSAWLASLVIPIPESLIRNYLSKFG